MLWVRTFSATAARVVEFITSVCSQQKVVGKNYVQIMSNGSDDDLCSQPFLRALAVMLNCFLNHS
jgi:hypothetical protein